MKNCLMRTLNYLFAFVFISNHLYSVDSEKTLPNYETEVLPINIDITSDYTIKGLSDSGLILLDCGSEMMGVYDPEAGLNLISSKSEYPKPIAINNLGHVLCKSSYKTSIWSKNLGIRHLDILNSEYHDGIDFNDWGQVIGTYRVRDSNGNDRWLYRPFLWDSGFATDMGPGSEFCQQFESLGYHVMDITLTSINNSGEIVGYFTYGKFNKKNNKYTSVGMKIFFWNGDVHTLPIDTSEESFQYGSCPSFLKLNNKGVVVCGMHRMAYIWSKGNKIKEINNFYPLSLNDHAEILGFIHYIGEDRSEIAIWLDGNITLVADLLGINNLNKLSNKYNDSYEVEQLKDFGFINNKGQISCTAVIWGDDYPCILNPKK